MKRFMKVLLSAALASALILTALPATAEEKPISVTLDGETVVFPDAKPYMENGRVMVPIRFVSESMGAQVEWVPSKYRVDINRGSYAITISVGTMSATVNGEQQVLDVLSRIKNDRVYVPLRFVSQSMGAFVKWEESSRTVIITTSSPYGKGEEITVEDGKHGTTTVTMYDVVLPFREVRSVRKVDDQYVEVVVNKPESFQLYLEPMKQAESNLLLVGTTVCEFEKVGEQYVALYRVDLVPGKSIEEYPTLALRFGADRHLYFRFPNPLYKRN